MTLGREEREREEEEGVEGGGWELEDVRGCFARGAALWEIETLILATVGTHISEVHRTDGILGGGVAWDTLYYICSSCTNRDM